MTRTDRLLNSWSEAPVKRRLFLLGLLAVALYLNAKDSGPGVAAAYFAAVAGILPVLLLAAFIHARDIVTASVTRLKDEHREIEQMQSDVNQAMFQHMSLMASLGSVVPEYAEKIRKQEELRDKLDQAVDGFEKEEEEMEAFGERWSDLLVCTVEIAAVGEAVALVALASPSPVLPPAVLSGAMVALVLLLVTWAVTMLVEFTTRPSD